MAPERSTLPGGTRIGRTALRVSDREATTEFYRTVVGLDLHEQSETRSVLGAGGTPLLVLEADPEAPRRPESTAGLFHTAFRVPSRAALGDALGRIRDNWQLDGATDHRVSEALYLTDPEGNGVEIYRDFPVAEWPVAGDGRIRLGNDPLDTDAVAAAAGGRSQAPPGTDIGHLHLEVSSLAAFREFYVESLGFEVKTDLTDALFVSVGEYHHHVAGNTWHGRTEPRDGRGLSWFELLIPERRELRSLRERLADTLGTVTETAEGFSVTDADGIEIHLREAGATDGDS
jgi:catechol 2,3-dioxygenase